MSPSAVMETILRFTFGFEGRRRRETLFEVSRQRIRAIGGGRIVLNEIRRQVFADQFRVMGLKHLAKQVQDELLVRFELFVFTLYESFGVVNPGDGCLRKKWHAGDQSREEKFHALYL